MTTGRSAVEIQSAVAAGRRSAMGVVLASVALVGVARAHGSSVDAPPVPIPVVLVAGAVAVAGTALALAFGPDPPTGRRRLGSISVGTHRALGNALAALVLVGLVGSVASGLASAAAVTFAERFVWPVLFKGTLAVAVLVGLPWRVISPWERAYDAIARLEGEAVGAWSYPSRLGSWPAVAGVVLVVGVVENLTLVPASGRLTVAFLAAYAFVMLLGGLAFGREWFARADAFTVLYDLAGRVAPIAVERNDENAATRGGRLRVVARPPWVGATRPLADGGVATFVVVLVATVTFDGAVETTAAAGALATLEGVVGASAGVLAYAIALAGFLAAAVAVAAMVRGAAGAVAPTAFETATDFEASTLLQFLAATLVPIAVAYDLAHNAAYVLVNAVAILELALGAIGLPVAVNASAVLPPVGVWALQVVLVVAGHLVAVVAAHCVTTAGFSDARAARRAHAPLAALMVVYTAASLYVLAAP